MTDNLSVSIDDDKNVNSSQDVAVSAKTSEDDFPISTLAAPVDRDEKIENETLLTGATKDVSVTIENTPTISRLVIATWKIRQNSLLIKALKPGVEFYQYKADATYSSILSGVKNILKGQRVTSIAYLCHGNPGTLVICNEKVLTAANFDAEKETKSFLKELLKEILVEDSPNVHLDFLASPLPLSNDGQAIVQALKTFLNVPITVNKDILGSDGKRHDRDIQSVGEIYFNANLLRSWSGSGSQSISSYEKIRTLGRGAFGTAVLYRKKDDDSLVVLKEISMLDLAATERQSAMNEVKVLSILSHPNIVSYFDSFDEDGTLWIEMEYADGGTLAEFLLKQESDLEERDILIMFSQMVSAIKYCHDHNILHRDLKTQNIFLTQEGKVKLGDFGIAKIMTSHNAGNFTVVGTPYYISPEMCEGKPYDHQSDIWALGCILYEMANLTKTFDGTNLPALINKIVKGTFAPIKEIYSPEFRMLFIRLWNWPHLLANTNKVRDLLQKESADRPPAQEILFNRLPELLQRYDDQDSEIGDTSMSYQRTRSILYYCDASTMQLYEIEDLPVKIQITEVAIGLGHVAAVSLERGIFTWGDNSYGQLGHGDYESRSKATEVELLRGKSIIRVICGDYYTAFLSDNGLILTCGQGDFGCLGHNDWVTLTRPRLLDALLTLDIANLNGGLCHLAATTKDGDVYTWGCGFDGRLGHGNEDHLNLPTKLSFPDGNIFISDVRCSNDGTVFIADTGAIFACGRNTGNKLGLNPRQGFLLQFRSRANKVVEVAKVPTLIKDMCKFQMTDIKFGSGHSALINSYGHVYTNGNNSSAQLGCGNSKPREAVTAVRGFEDVPVSMVCCGSTFSMAAVLEQKNKATLNSVYFWGTRPKFKKSRNASSNESLSARSSARKTKSANTIDEEGSINESLDISSSYENGSSNSPGIDVRKSGDFRRNSGTETARGDIKTFRSSYSEDLFRSEEEEMVRSSLRSIFRGAGIQQLNLVPRASVPSVIPYAAFRFESISGIEGYDESEEFPVVLHDLKCTHDHVIIHLETTAPPPKHQKSREKSLDSSLSSVTSNFKEESSETSEMDTSGEVPTWIRKELEEGIAMSNGNEEDIPVYVDNGDESTEVSRVGTPVKPLPFAVPKLKGFETLTRRNTQAAISRDPNFNLIPKLQKQGTLLKIKESVTPSSFSETRIIDGVSFTTSTAKIESRPTSSMSLKQKPTRDENNNEVEKIGLPLDTTQLPGSLSPQLKNRRLKGNGEIEYTPVEKFSPSSTLKTKNTIAKSKSPVPFGKARSKKKEKTEAAYRAASRNVTKDKLLKHKRFNNERPSSQSDVDDNSHDEERKLIDMDERQAKLSEEKLREEIKQLQKEKSEQEQALKELHELELKQKEEKRSREKEEAKAREEALKNEILNLKSDLNNQNSKLQDNYNILLSLQEQLLHMQQNQMRSNTMQKLSTQQLNEAIEAHSQKNTVKSSVCAVM